MLVLTRKDNESLVLYDKRTNTPYAKITLVRIQGNSVRIGIDAPATVGVLREELAEAALGAGFMSQLAFSH